MDYLSYWGLLRKPFTDNPSGAFFSGNPQREALAGLSYFVASGWESAFLVGPQKCGTSSLLRHAERMDGFGDCAADVVLTSGIQATGQAACADLAAALGIQGCSCEIVNAAIDASAREGIRTVWLIDRPRPAAAAVARELVIANRQLSVVMGITPAEIARTAAAFGRCSMQIELTPLTLEDTLEYLQHGPTHAGMRRSPFSDVAMVRLHELTAGVLAELSRAAESALALAASHGLDQVTPAIVEAIHERLQARAA